MNIGHYATINDSSFLTYKFESIGPKGIIKKVVLYRKLNIRNETTYNLSFGDWDEINGRINDIAISNNNDTTKVLFTVGLTVLEFVKHFPNAKVLIVGSTDSRTRLYQMAINQHYKAIAELFEIEGYRNGYWEKFIHGRNFEAFLIKSNVKNL